MAASVRETVVVLREAGGNRAETSAPPEGVGTRLPAGARLLAPLLVAIGGPMLIALDATPWLLAGLLGLVGLVATGSVARRPAPTPGDDELQRQMMRCRRRGERAHVLVVVIEPARDRSLSALIGAMRATDAFVVHRSWGRTEIRALLDGESVDRAAVEQRLAASLDGSDSAAFGWAAFPDDGFALDVLIEAAREDAHATLPTRPARIRR